jgi:hypothetical protein
MKYSIKHYFYKVIIILKPFCKNTFSVKGSMNIITSIKLQNNYLHLIYYG